MLDECLDFTIELLFIPGSDAMASNGSGGGPGVGLGGPPEGVLFRSEPMSRYAF